MSDYTFNLDTARGIAETYQKDITTDRQIALDSVEKNQLHQFATYNYIFTLSGLKESEIRNPKEFMTSSPHDIIARTGGIGNPASSSNISQAAEEAKKLLNERELASIDRAKSILNLGRDIYFENVNMDSIHGFNSERRTGSVTKIIMRLNEPAGVTILEKLKAAASNSGYKDHISAPYLLTIQFRGFDEQGKIVTADALATKRYIPIKIVKMNIKVNTAGAIYDLDCIPYNEVPYLNRYNFIRTNMKLEGSSTGVRTFLQDFNNKLNKMTEDEAKRKVFTDGMQDTYQITVDPSFADVPLKTNGDQVKNSKTVSLNDYEVDPESTFLRNAEAATTAYKFNVAGELNANTAIIKVLEEAMTSLQPIQEVWTDWFQRTTSNLREKTGKQILSNVDIASLNEEDFKVKWFRIKAAIETDITRFDRLTKSHPKTIKFHIEPYDLHIFRLVKPGLSLGGQNKVKVKKLYDYIFTGNNTDILDLDINYKVAWYITKLPPNNPHNKDRISFEEDVSLLSQIGAEDQIEELLPTQSAPGTVRSTRSGLFSTEKKQDVDLFMDALTNPTADMVKVQLKIIGDPSWIGVSQFLPANVENTGSGVGSDKNIRDLGFVGQWSNQYKSFNTDIADPVIRLNFKMPSDLDDVKGVYELGRTQSAVFSGLYQVYKVESIFANGAFTQTLHMTRFNNQSNSAKTKTLTDIYYIFPDGRTVPVPQISDYFLDSQEDPNLNNRNTNTNANNEGDTF